MTASLFDSPVWRATLHDPELSTLFTDTAALRANLLVMGSLVLTQAKAGTVPDVSAQAIQRAAMEVQIDPGALAADTAETGDPMQALINGFRAEMKAPEHAKWIHHASDTALTAATGLSLRLRQTLRILGKRLPSDAERLPPATLAVYHPKPATRAGLAAGLDLMDAHDETPQDALCFVSSWIAHNANTTQAQTDIGAAVLHQTTAFDHAIQSAPPAAKAMVQSLLIPQMILGLGYLTR